MSNTVTVPNVGRVQTLGFGLQTTKGTAVPATVFFPVTGGSDLDPEFRYEEPDFADGNFFDAVPQLMGVYYQGKSRDFYPTQSLLQFLSLHQLRTEAGDYVAATGVITPQAAKNWHANMPLVPLTMEVNHPVVKLRVTDVQIYEFRLNFQLRQFLTASLSFHGVKPENASGIGGFTFAPATLAETDTFYNHRDLSVSWNGNLKAVETLTLTLTIGLAPVDGTGNGLFILGFERNANISCTVEFTMAGSDSELDAAFSDTGNSVIVDDFEVKLQKGSALWKVVGRAMIQRKTTPAGLDRVTTSYTAKFVSEDNATPGFAVHVTPVP
ncbi:hypothetical protein [Deinococcus misasensis]|uniref:hypothetical protein n=1 Tax=Deinococcus misasensis TaxID=392413 RepID=UPI00054E7E65|nr:hypothetical protein [Deinococcus misasensis]